jgi:hypothetical protein
VRYYICILIHTLTHTPHTHTRTHTRAHTHTNTHTHTHGAGGSGGWGAASERVAKASRLAREEEEHKEQVLVYEPLSY